MKQAGIPLKNAVPVFKPKGPALKRLAGCVVWMK